MNWSPLGSSVLGLSRQEYWSGLPFPITVVLIICVHMFDRRKKIFFLANTYLTYASGETVRGSTLIETAHPGQVP